MTGMFNVEFRQAPIPDPNRDALTDPVAPFEPPCVLRLLQEGWSAPQICKELGMSKRQLMHELNLAIDDQKEAERLGQKVVCNTVADYKRDAMKLMGWK